jgi:hypothetical protein
MLLQFAILYLFLFYSALLAFVIVITPAVLGQFLYDTAQKIRGHPLGWLLLTAMFCAWLQPSVLEIPLKRIHHSRRINTPNDRAHDNAKPLRFRLRHEGMPYRWPRIVACVRNSICRAALFF